ncbi:hypothetical protein ACFY1P_31390 [Streptomyces sp. NPDC001407]|uniref:hypothetical protein n=1 Tax=Streptomyces sp. NPDC001407 TaxID=3364573 RepID=UPI0036A7DF88
MNSLATVLWGMLGALAPEIVRLYTIRRNPRRFQWSWYYVLVSIAFAGLGGAMALALPATTAWAALYVGISTPTVVTTIVRKGKEVAAPELKATPGRTIRLSVVDTYLYGL